MSFSLNLSRLQILLGFQIIAVAGEHEKDLPWYSNYDIEEDPHKNEALIAIIEGELAVGGKHATVLECVPDNHEPDGDDEKLNELDKDVSDEINSSGVNIISVYCKVNESCDDQQLQQDPKYRCW